MENLRKTRREAWQAYLIACIQGTGSEREKLIMLESDVKSSFRELTSKAISEYLADVNTDLPFYNDDIIDVGVRFGFLDAKKITERGKEKFIHEFFKRCGAIYLKLIARAQKPNHKINY